MPGPRILLIVGGGIAAYKSCELVRMIRKGGGSVTCVLTEGGSHFVTPMALAALSESPVHTSLWDLKNEVEMGHIQLSRQADLVVLCPATADLMARMAAGIADDLATTLLLATDKPVMVVPAMNVRMWQHAATTRNVAALREVGVFVMDPEEGAMACGEFGPGRLPEPEAVWRQIAAFFTGPEALPMQGGGKRWKPVMPEPRSEDIPVFGEGGDDDQTWVPGPGGSEGAAETGNAESGLGGLSASLVQRGRAIALDDETPLPPAETAPVAEPDPDATPAAGGPLLVAKGRAKSAPPTDPEALNHLVGQNAAPEPIAGDRFAISVLRGADDASVNGGPVYADFIKPDDGPLSGRHVLVTAGPTHEPIDPVRYIANRSSGQQGFAIAAAAARAGARVTLVTGPVRLATPPGVDRIDVETARQMQDAVKKALPADCAVMVAAVADWRTKDVANSKLKKRGSAPPVLVLTENPDILAGLGSSPLNKPRLLVGFAAETDKVVEHATEKRKRKGADWIIANDVSFDKNGRSVMGGAKNTVHIVTRDGVEDLPEMAKEDVASVLVERIAHALNE
ncbi:bifunctional phosphopantothenoylcysteine decarboxylase/phosphopantothenate synthase [Novosphingobium flavum]|uniref:Coenzyme A biosynthesis bifunctional protein CoaBC n=1 Tax=Novosphingobium flavum TaxID=1778672 RepID=A0A7X1FV12_9SPHN|nr:bifunctional phosphopantothenoylcysteine decarboxylase/phosphopantothenate synthase [Novosphingobium flavum]MBC2666932.1 bifunctional phosphopantothenoylcysteine decarboxylase/phosphopantothenate synthase [Novosphingobium flavum]